MKSFVLKGAVVLGMCFTLWNCGSDSSSSSSGGETPECDIALFEKTLPLWTGAYFIFPDGTVKSGEEIIGTFDASTGSILNGEGTVIANGIDSESLPFFDGENLVYKNCTVTNLEGDSLGVLDSLGQVVSSSSSLDKETPSSSSEGIFNPLSSADVPQSSSAETPVSSSSEKGNGSGEMDASGYEIANYNPDITNNGKTGWSSRYWDACKPHCSWISSGEEGKPDTTSQAKYEETYTAARNCNINDYEIPAFTLSRDVQQYWMGYAGTTSACDVGAKGAFTCTDMAPVAVNDTLSYAFVAGPGSSTTCGKCFHLQFNGGNHDNNVKATHKALKGKHLVVMTSNIGHDVENGQFDLMVPGGGVGIFDALTTMVKKSGINWGAQYGGFLTECQKSLGYDNSVQAYQSCIRDMCEAAFTGHENLLKGCTWFADWYMAADNPTYNWEEVDCPQYLIDKYKTTINTTTKTDIAWQDDWSGYTGGEFVTKECSSSGCP